MSRRSIPTPQSQSLPAHPAKYTPTLRGPRAGAPERGALQPGLLAPVSSQALSKIRLALAWYVIIARPRLLQSCPMCQLLGMNCNVPTDICFSFTGFRMRGGNTDEHRDGWGIAFFEGRGCRLFIDSKPSAHSPVADLVRDYPIRSLNVIAHIRKATRGPVALENTHPFMRELWGRYWIFAHNGTLREFNPPVGERYRPVGQTDSEQAFCYFLQSLCAGFPNGEPSGEGLAEALSELTREVARYGDFNYLLSNGEYLFAHCATRLHYIVRKAPFPTAHLKDQDVTVDFSTVTTPNDRVCIIATIPLTDNENWTAMAPGEFMQFQDGAPLWGSTAAVNSSERVSAMGIRP
jgi:predicted glutamine amidotransferase